MYPPVTCCLRRFSLGDKPPLLTGVKVYDSPRVRESIVLEADATWASHQDVQLTVRGIAGHGRGFRGVLSAVPETPLCWWPNMPWFLYKTRRRGRHSAVRASAAGLGLID